MSTRLSLRLRHKLLSAERSLCAMDRDARRLYSLSRDRLNSHAHVFITCCHYSGRAAAVSSQKRVCSKTLCCRWN